MPFINIQTNVPSQEITDDLIKTISATGAKLTGKPEGFVAVKVSGGERLFFGGTNEPAAMVEFVSIGLEAKETKGISSALMTVIEEKLNISPKRVYIRFFDPPGHLIGWNKDTF